MRKCINIVAAAVNLISTLRRLNIQSKINHYSYDMLEDRFEKSNAKNSRKNVIIKIV